MLLLQRKNAQENTQFRNNNLGPNILFGHCLDRVKRKEFYVQYGVTSGIPFFLKFIVLTRDNQFKV